MFFHGLQWGKLLVLLTQQNGRLFDGEILVNLHLVARTLAQHFLKTIEEETDIVPCQFFTS